MEAIDRIIEQGSEHRETPSDIEKLRREVESFSRQLALLEKMETLLKQKYYKRLENLIGQFDRTDKYQGELKSLAKQLKKNKQRQSIIKEQIQDLEKHKKIIRQVMKQVTGYEKSSGAQIDILKTEREVLCQRGQDLMQLLQLAEQTELTAQEIKTVCQRVRATEELLEEIEADLRKRTIDLLFEFYIPPKNKKLWW
ncbi:MAG TPA: hypothetical protein VMY79_03755 [Dehalococcoidia bacterium]|nr:hypothetical protein [Dehalococcoidia bacterium]